MPKLFDRDLETRLDKDEQLSKFYKKEFEEYLIHLQNLNNDNLSLDELKENYSRITNSYYKSLRKMMKITNIGDSTQLKLIKAQEILREQEEKIRAIFENAVIGLTSINLEGYIITANTNLYEMLNLEANDEMMNSLNDINIKDFLIDDKDRIFFIEKCKQIRDDKIDSFREKIRLKGKNGIFWSDFSVSAIYNTRNEPESLIVIIANIDEEVKAKHKLEESYKKLKNAQDEILNLERKNTALAMVVTTNHEINQPLMIMKANLEMLEMKLEEVSLKQDISKYLNRIDQSVERINKILEKFRSYDTVEFEEYGGNTKMVSFKMDDTEDFDY
ncbi:MAG: PAS domain S-box protein [Candidatus Cloacimonetes bacterium]|nr:PAS domain S-box protein [Candidatus Cloacimonadota bacterium]